MSDFPVSSILLPVSLHSLNHPLPPLFIGALGFLKNYKRGGSIFSCKNVGCLKKEGKQCCSLIMYEFCSGNALYSASVSFRMLFWFLLLLILEIATISAVYKKACNFVF